MFKALRDHFTNLLEPLQRIEAGSGMDDELMREHHDTKLIIADTIPLCSIGWPQTESSSPMI